MYLHILVEVMYFGTFFDAPSLVLSFQLLKVNGVKGHMFSFKDHWAVVRMWIVGPKCRMQVTKK